jgi:hypothetical protein
MVKNIFFTCVILFTGSLFSQTCIPDKNLTKSGFLPAVLPAAVVNTPYNEGISVLTFRDTYTTVLGSKVAVKVDSIKVLRIGGLPAGLSYKCQHPRCVFLWDTVRCISFYGTATQAGSYPLKIYVRAFVKVGGFTSTTQNDSISSYTLEVVNNTASVWNTASSSFRVSPNPASDIITIQDAHQNLDWFITDVSGRRMNCSVVESSKQAVTISVKNLKSGLYIVTDGRRKEKLLIP